MNAKSCAKFLGRLGGKASAKAKKRKNRIRKGDIKIRHAKR